MKKKLVLFFLLLSTLSYSQRSSEIGVFAGMSYYIGDLNPYKHFDQPHFSGGILFRRNLNKRFTFRFSGTYGTVSGADSLSTNPNTVSRNLNFRSRIIEIGPIIELNFVKYAPGNTEKDPATMYLFTGFTFFHMNPQATLNGEYYDLQILGTEGQGSSLNSKGQYKLNQLSIPLGIGIKGNLTKRICVSLEYGIRKTFTDYIDDVSGNYVDPTLLSQENGVLSSYFANQNTSTDPSLIAGTPRGNPKTKDWYSFSGVMLTIKLGKPGTCDNFKKNRY